MRVRTDPVGEASRLLDPGRGTGEIALVNLELDKMWRDRNRGDPPNGMRMAQPPRAAHVAQERLDRLDRALNIHENSTVRPVRYRSGDAVLAGGQSDPLPIVDALNLPVREAVPVRDVVHTAPKPEGLLKVLALPALSSQIRPVGSESWKGARPCMPTAGVALTRALFAILFAFPAPASHDPLSLGRSPSGADG